MREEPIGQEKSAAAQSLNIESLDQFYIEVEPTESKSLSQVKMETTVVILKTISFKQCIVFYNDKGRGDQIVAELR